jgi:hypothetical protein
VHSLLPRATPLRCARGPRQVAKPGAPARLRVACRKALAASGFWFERSYAQVISGQREGQLGWTAVNYAAGGLQAAMRSQRRRRRQQRGAAPPRFQGLLELGGASVQVTFLSEEQHGLASSLGLPGACDGRGRHGEQEAAAAPATRAVGAPRTAGGVTLAGPLACRPQV